MASELLSNSIAPTHYGPNCVLTKAETSVDRNGLMTGVCVFLLKFQETVITDGPKKGDIHPIDIRLAIETLKTSYGPGICRITANYTGMEDNSADDSEPVYSLNVGTQQEPIETHPDFATFAGTPSAPLNKAVFIDAQNNEVTAANPADPADNEKYKFSRFQLDSPLKGLDSFLDSTNTTWTQKYTSSVKPSDGGDVGEIDSNLPGNPPSFGGNRNWLYTGMAFDQRAHVYSITRSWRLSGKDGWKSQIY